MKQRKLKTLGWRLRVVMNLYKKTTWRHVALKWRPIVVNKPSKMKLFKNDAWGWSLRVAKKLCKITP
jgi:hypothetical protein